MTGWLEVDFIDDLEDDVITTARQSLNWEHNEMEKLQRHLQGLIKWLERDWREKRKQAREKEISEKTGIDIQSWLDKTPEDIRQKIMPVLEAVVRQSELPVKRFIQKSSRISTTLFPNTRITIGDIYMMK